MPDTPSTRAILRAAAVLASMGVCGYCHTLDGMAAWTPRQLRALVTSNGVWAQGPWIAVGVKFYRHHTTKKRIFSPCWWCRADGYVADGYVALTTKQVRRWLKAQS